MPHLASAIEVAGLHKTFRSRFGTYAVLQDVSLDIAEGEFVSLVGPSGSGKSTLLNMLAGLEHPQQGVVRILGAPQVYPAPVAYMQQKDLLLPWRTLWDNILLGPEIRSKAERGRLHDEAAALVQAFHLDGFTDAYPAQLSGGMRQRAALIRTLLCEQPILLLDEPFSGVDALTRGHLQQYLLEMWRQYRKTVVLVTHDVEEALLLSDRVLVLSARPGRLIGEFPMTLPRPARAQSPETLRLKTRIVEMLDSDEA